MVAGMEEIQDRLEKLDHLEKVGAAEELSSCVGLAVPGDLG